MAVHGLPEMPCGPILELHGQRKRFHIPYGLKALIEDMTREVLRVQPENIYEFLATFMEARLQKRYDEEAKKSKRKSWENHRWSWEGPSVLEPEELTEFLETFHTPVGEANHHAVVIQAAFRGYQARKKVKDLKKSHDEEVRKSLELEAKRKSQAESEEGERAKRDSKGSSEGGTRRRTLDITDENATVEEQKAAVTIQAAFKGMHARKLVKEMRDARNSHDHEEGGEKRPSQEADQEAKRPSQATDKETKRPSQVADQETKRPSQATDQDTKRPSQATDQETKRPSQVNDQETKADKDQQPPAEEPPPLTSEVQGDQAETTTSPPTEAQVPPVGETGDQQESKQNESESAPPNENQAQPVA